MTKHHHPAPAFAPRHMMPVVVRGMRFATVPECAKHFRVKTSSVYAALSTGRVDTLGLGRGKARTTPVNSPPRPPKAVSLPGGDYPSRRQASVAIGRNPGYCSNVIRKHGYEEGMRRIREAALLWMMQNEQKARAA